jgi:hypothetical protein
VKGTGAPRIPLTADEFAALLSRISSVIGVDNRLPSWPFSSHGGHVAVAQFGRLLSAEFIDVLEVLSTTYGDDKVFLAVLDPAPSYYVANYDFQPGFEVDVAELTTGYWPGVSYEPRGDPTGAIAYTANDVALVGSTGKWAVWGQRDWDLVLVQAPRAGRWLTAGVPFVSPVEALEYFTAVERRTNPVSPEDLSLFLTNFSA